jgi:hypothetical protein
MIYWTALAGGATALAALVTAWMAIETRKVAKATQTSAEASRTSVEQDKQQLVKLTEQTEAIISQAQLARATLKQSSLPLLLPVVAWKYPPMANLATSDTSHILFEHSGRHLPVNPEMRGSMILQDDSPDSSLWIVIEIRNIGTGLAILTSPILDVSRDSVGGTFFAWQWSSHLTTPVSQRFTSQEPAVPPGEVTKFVARLNDPDGSAWNSLIGANPADLRQIETVFVYKDLTQEYTYKMSVNFGLALDNKHPESILLRPGTPIYEGYDLDGIDDLGARA